MSRELRVNRDDVLEMMTGTDSVSYLNLESGEVVTTPEESLDEDDEFLQELEEHPECYEEVPKFESREEFDLLAQGRNHGRGSSIDRGDGACHPPLVILESGSIIMPAWNEEGAVERSVREVVAAAPRVFRRWELLLVDDGSVDATPRIATRLAKDLPGIRVLTHEEHRGLGAAYRTGLRAARHEYVCMVPTDGQFPAGDLSLLAERANGCDVVCGWRRNRPDPPRRKIVTIAFRWVVFALFGISVRDMGWVKLYRRALLERLDLRSTGMGIDTELLVGAVREGGRFAQVRVGYRPRATGRSSGDDPCQIWRTVREILAVRFGRTSGIVS